MYVCTCLRPSTWLRDSINRSHLAVPLIAYVTARGIAQERGTNDSGSVSSGPSGYSSDRRIPPLRNPVHLPRGCQLSCWCHVNLERSVRFSQTGSLAVDVQCHAVFLESSWKRLRRAAVEAATDTAASNTVSYRRWRTVLPMDFTSIKNKGDEILNFSFLVVRCEADALRNLEEECNTSKTKSQRSRAGIPSMREPASREIISDSVELCETEVCFWHIQLRGTNVWLPKIHRIHPEVDFVSSRSPAKSECWNSPSLHCCAVFPIWQHCLKSLVWCTKEIKRAKRLSRALVHFVTACASLFCRP